MKVWLTVAIVVVAAWGVVGQGEWFRKEVATTLADGAASVVAADFDGDGDMDLASASDSDHKVAWYENTDGRGTFGPQQVVSTAALAPRSVIAADLDDDGDMDLASASFNDNKIAWFENTDGAGMFGPQQVVSTAASGAQSVIAADLDGDGDMDLASASYNDNKIAWYENTDGSGTFGPQQVVTTAAGSAQSVFAADVDGDGDLDLASASQSDDKIAWYENLDGFGTFGAQHVVSASADGARSVFAADIDGDGDVDLVSASSNDDKIAWYENTDGAGTFGAQQVVSSLADDVWSVISVDIDGDGDMDLASASRNDDKVAWYENTDGTGTFGATQVVSTTAKYAYSVFAADIDGDGGVDLLSASYNDDTIAWYAITLSYTSARVLATSSVIEEGGTGVVPVRFDGLPPNVSYIRAQLTSALSARSFIDADGITVPFTLSFPPSAPSSFLVDIVFTAISRARHIVFVVVLQAQLINSPALFSVAFSCPPGTYSLGLECIECPSNTYSTNNSSALCTPCPLRMSGRPGSSDFRNCGCREGEWVGAGPRVEGALCEPCPPGAVCQGGLADPVAAPGYFESPAFPSTFVACLRAGCSGNGTCARGYTNSFLCSGCTNGFFSRSPETCEPCPSGSGARFAALIVGLVVAALLAAAFVAWSASRVASLSSATTSSKQAHILSFRARTTPVSVAMIVTSFQLVSIIAEAELGWSSASKSVLSVFGVFTINAQVLGSECALASFYMTYAVSILLPLVTLAAVLGFVFTAKALAGSISHFAVLADLPIRTLFDSAIFTLAPLFYIPLSRSTFVLFDCVRLPNGDVVVEADNGVACFDSAWWSIFPLGSLCALVYVVGVPAYFGVTLFVRRHKLFDPSTTKRFGTLYRNWRRAFYWGEVANLGKRLVIVAAATFLSRHQVAQILIIVTVLVASLAAVLNYKPYFLPFYNGVEARLTTCVVAVFLIGAASYSERASTSTDSFFLVATIAAVVALLAVATHALFTDIVSLYRERNAMFVAAGERQKQLVGLISDELKDVEAGPELLHAAGEFLAVLDLATRGEVAQRDRAGTTALGDIELDEL